VKNIIIVKIPSIRNDECSSRRSLNILDTIKTKNSSLKHHSILYSIIIKNTFQKYFTTATYFGNVKTNKHGNPEEAIAIKTEAMTFQYSSANML